MVFLFPGILCRRAFFSGDFNKHFESGNTFERLLWNMLVSIIMLITFCLSIHFYNLCFTSKIEFDLKTEQITDTFICIYENKLPTIFTSEIKIIQTIKLLISVYLFSVLLGYSINRIIFYLGLEKRFSILQFQNNWQYLTNSNKQNNLSHSAGDIYYTKVDVKTKTDELFTGKLHNLSFDKEGKIEAITIQDAYKFYRLKFKDDTDKIEEIKKSVNENDPHLLIHSETSTSFVFRKRIKGDLFTIFNNEIENISITYIKISNFYRKFQKVLKIFLSILILLITILSISYAIWDFQIISFSSYSRRLMFCIISPIVVIFALLLLTSLTNRIQFRDNKKKYFNQVKDSILILILFSLPYLYVFSILKGWLVILFLFLYLIILGKFLSTASK